MAKKAGTKVLAALLAGCMIVSLAAGCGKSEGSAAPSSSAAASASSSSVSASSSVPSSSVSEAPTAISIMVNTEATTMIDNTNVIWKAVEEKTNTKLDITFSPSSTWTDKLNVTLASGNLPDVTAVQPFASNVLSMATDGAFWDLTNQYQSYENLKKIPEVVWKNTRYPDGKNYFIPLTRPTTVGGPLSIRQDWLDALNLKTPETLDDVYNVLKAFVENDPDKNGKNDTIGLVSFIRADGTGLDSLEALFCTAFGAQVGLDYVYVNDSGVLDTAITTPEFKSALSWMHKLYADGLMSKDFITMKQQQERDVAMTGKVGMTTENMPGSWVVTAGLRKVVPNGHFVNIPTIKTLKGKDFAKQGTGYFAAWAIKKQGVDEAKLKKILTFFDYTYSDEGSELCTWGFSGTHFTKTGDIYTQTAQAATDKIGQTYMGKLTGRYDPYFYAKNAPGIPLEEAQANEKRADEITKAAVPVPTDGLVSQAWIQYGNEYGKKLTDQMIKVIIGTSDLNSWDSFAAGIAGEANYKKIVSEFQTAYKVKMGN